MIRFHDGTTQQRHESKHNRDNSPNSLPVDKFPPVNHVYIGISPTPTSSPRRKLTLSAFLVLILHFSLYLLLLDCDLFFVCNQRYIVYLIIISPYEHNCLWKLLGVGNRDQVLCRYTKYLQCIAMSFSFRLHKEKLYMIWHASICTMWRNIYNYNYYLLYY